MKSWKIGAIAGLITGIVGSIVTIFLAVYMIENGLVYHYLAILPITPIKQIAIVEITINVIWGIALGIIYSRIYSKIPGKAIVKGFTVGIIYSLIYCVRWASICYMYNIMHNFEYLIPLYIFIGLVLGITYEFLRNRFLPKREKVVAIKYDIKGVIHPGAIAGSVAGLSSFFYTVVIMNPLLWPELEIDLGLVISQLGTLVLFNMIWGIVFGILFAMFYERVPKKGILKGLIFSMAVFFFTNIPNVMRNMIYSQLTEQAYGLMIALWVLLAALFVFVPFGLVLGLLYKPPK